MLRTAADKIATRNPRENGRGNCRKRAPTRVCKTFSTTREGTAPRNPTGNGRRNCRKRVPTRVCTTFSTTRKETAPRSPAESGGGNCRKRGSTVGRQFDSRAQCPQRPGSAPPTTAQLVGHCNALPPLSELRRTTDSDAKGQHCPARDAVPGLPGRATTARPGSSASHWGQCIAPGAVQRPGRETQ